MSRSGYPEVLFIELARPGSDTGACIGSDAIYYVDGRYGRERVQNEIYDRYASYLARGYRILGYTVRGDHSRIRSL